MNRSTFHLAAVVASCSTLVVALAACGSNDGPSTAQSQGRSIVRSPSVVACPDNVLCIRGDHWDSTLCQCVPDGASDDAGAVCPDLVLCVRGDHWDTGLCRCVPDDDAGAALDGSATPDAGSDDDAGSCTGQ